jgi:hypothetical protein
MKNSAESERFSRLSTWQRKGCLAYKYKEKYDEEARRFARQVRVVIRYPGAMIFPFTAYRRFTEDGSFTLPDSRGSEFFFERNLLNNFVTDLYLQ